MHGKQVSTLTATLQAGGGFDWGPFGGWGQQQRSSSGRQQEEEPFYGFTQFFEDLDKVRPGVIGHCLLRWHLLRCMDGGGEEISSLSLRSVLLHSLLCHCAAVCSCPKEGHQWPQVDQACRSSVPHEPQLLLAGLDCLCMLVFTAAKADSAFASYAQSYTRGVVALLPQPLLFR